MDSKTLIVAALAVGAIGLLMLQKHHEEPAPAPTPPTPPDNSNTPAPPPFSFGGGLVDEDVICRRFPSLCLRPWRM